MPLRITFLITDLDRGGCPLWLAGLAPGLAARGWDVDVVSLAPAGEIADLLRQRGIAVSSLNAKSAADWRILPALVRHLQQRSPHIIFSVLIHANLVATLAHAFARIPAIYVQSIHTLQKEPRWHWFLQGFLCLFADAFVAPSHAIVSRLRQFGPLPASTRVIPNGIDVARFYDAPPIPQNQIPWPKDAWVVGYVGRFDPVKRLPVLLHALALLPDQTIHLALVGYGRQETYLRQLATELGVESRVHFIGMSREPEHWYKVFDLFCSPSPAEGFGLTLVEARAAGLPVMACHTDAVAETLGHALWLPETCTPADVAQAILRVRSNLRGNAQSLLTGHCITENEMCDSYQDWLAVLTKGL